MKKTFLVVIMTTLGAFMTLKAQVGINQELPQATLHVDGNDTATDPSGVIVPRYTASALNDKNAAYGAAQNGTLVFVTSGTGVAATKTSEITGTGFYYYNSTTSKWTAVGGGAASTAFGIKTGQAATTGYDWSNSTSISFWEFTSGTQLTLPTPASYIGRTIYIRNRGGGNLGFVTITPLGIASMSSLSAMQLYSDGTNWHMVSGR